MARSVSIAAIQPPAWSEGATVSKRRAFHLEQIERWLHAAGRAGADVAGLGETCTTNWVDAVASDPEFMKLLRRTSEHIVQGSAKSELLETAPHVV